MDSYLNGSLFRGDADKGIQYHHILFILCVKILSIMIRQNKNIKGIFIGETEYKISQYANDTEITLEGYKNSFEETVKCRQM